MIDLRSSRLGIRHLPCAVHQVDEPVEEIGRIVRAGRRLRVVLHAERRLVEQRQPFDDLVVEADVGDAARTVRRLERALDRGVDREAVVVAGDLDLAGREVLHRLVDAAVAVLELVGAETQCATEDLVAEADAEVRDLALEELLEQRDGVVGGGRVARAVRHEHAVGLDREDVLERRAGRQHVHLDAALGHPERRHALDAEVERGDGELLVADRRDDVRLVGRDLAGQVGAGHRRARPARWPAAHSTSVDVELMPARMAPRSRRWRVSARVSTPLMPDHALVGELVGERVGSSASCCARRAGSRTT